MRQQRQYQLLHWNEGMQCWDAHGTTVGASALDVEDRYVRVYGGRWKAEADEDALGVALGVDQWLDVLCYTAAETKNAHDRPDKLRLWGIIQDLRVAPPATTLKFLDRDDWGYLLAHAQDPTFNLLHRKQIEQQLAEQGFSYDLVEKYTVY